MFFFTLAISAVWLPKFTNAGEFRLRWKTCSKQSPEVRTPVYETISVQPFGITTAVNTTTILDRAVDRALSVQCPDPTANADNLVFIPTQKIAPSVRTLCITVWRPRHKFAVFSLSDCLTCGRTQNEWNCCAGDVAINYIRLV